VNCCLMRFRCDRREYRFSIAFPPSPYLVAFVTSMPALPHQHNLQDEDYINKSLLASIDDDPDNEDSVAATSYASTSNSSSSDSPSANYLGTAHNHQQQRSDPSQYHSETHINLGDHSSIPSLPSFYHNSSSIHSHPEFNSDYDPLKFHQPPSKLNGFIPTTSTKHSFNSYPNTTRFRHQANISTPPTASFRDPQPFYPASTSDVYPLHMSSPNQSHIQPFDPRASYDYSTAHSVNAPAHKNYLADQYNAPPTAHAKPLSQQPPYPSTQSQYTNGIHLSSQTPYGPHVPTNVAGTVPLNPGAPPGLISSNIANGSNTAINGEEISTIFVVGFPEDMQVRCNLSHQSGFFLKLIFKKFILGTRISKHVYFFTWFRGSHPKDS
jgi:hypothetical protein